LIGLTPAFLQKFELHPISETKFYLTVTNTKIEFNKNTAGIVESVTLYMGGKTQEAKKIK